MTKITSFVKSYFPSHIPPQYRILTLLFFFLFATILPSCRVKSGCASSQKAYTNNMERTKKRGKTALFDKSMNKKMKH